MIKTSNHTIPDRSPPGSTRTTPSAVHQDGGVKCATGASSKIRGRDITIGTWNTRTLRAAGKLQELTHVMDRYRWNILGLCEMRWKENEMEEKLDGWNLVHVFLTFTHWFVQPGLVCCAWRINYVVKRIYVYFKRKPKTFSASDLFVEEGSQRKLLSGFLYWTNRCKKC